jgi:hypothetical protein
MNHWTIARRSEKGVESELHHVSCSAPPNDIVTLNVGRGKMP